MIEQNIGRPAQTDCIQEPSNNLIDETWGRPSEGIRMPVRLDEATKEFLNDLKEAVEDHKLSDKLIEEAREMGKRCLGNPAFERMLQEQFKMACGMDTYLSADENGIRFGRMDSAGLMSRWGSNSTGVEIPLDGGSAVGYRVRQFGCTPGRREEIPVEEAASYVFRDPNRPNFPIYF